MTFEQIIQLIMGSLGALACLAVAVKWLESKLAKSQMGEMSERNARLELLEKSSERCAEDRVVLHKKIDAQDEKISAQTMELVKILKAVSRIDFSKEDIR
jgi:hypothetical protein